MRLTRISLQDGIADGISPVSIAGYVVVLGNTWEFAVVTSTFGLSNGGTAGALWMTIVVICGMMLNVLSLAEVASMAPTSGGQYRESSFHSLPRIPLISDLKIGSPKSPPLMSKSNSPTPWAG